MPGDVDYAFEKYWAGYTTMAEIEGSVADRLAAGYADQGHRTMPLRPGTGPAISDATATRIERFHALLAGKGSIEATVNAMDELELSKAASEFASITYALAEEYFTAHPAD